MKLKDIVFEMFYASPLYGTAGYDIMVKSDEGECPSLLSQNLDVAVWLKKGSIRDAPNVINALKILMRNTNLGGITLNDRIYYGIPGILLNEDLFPIFICTRYNGNKVFYASSLIFDGYRMENYIRNKLIPFLAFEGVKIVIHNSLTRFLLKPAYKKIDNEAMNKLISDEL